MIRCSAPRVDIGFMFHTNKSMQTAADGALLSQGHLPSSTTPRSPGRESSNDRSCRRHEKWLHTWGKPGCRRDAFAGVVLAENERLPMGIQLRERHQGGWRRHHRGSFDVLGRHARRQFHHRGCACGRQPEQRGAGERRPLEEHQCDCTLRERRLDSRHCEQWRPDAELDVGIVDCDLALDR